MKKSFVYLFILFFSSQLYAADLGTAKAEGLVGETPTGYIAAVTPASGEIQALIEQINAKRKAHYQKIATKNGTSLTAIEQVAGETAIKKTASGHFININGQWQKKP